jgi:hypothetical protein
MIKRELIKIIKKFEENDKRFDGYYSTEISDWAMMHTFTNLIGPSKNVHLE